MRGGLHLIVSKLRQTSTMDHNILFNSNPSHPPNIKPFFLTVLYDYEALVDDLKTIHNLIVENHCISCLTHKTHAITDHIRAETYCPKCGTVLSMAYPYVGGRKIENPFSYNYYIQHSFETEPLEMWAGYSRKSY